MLNLIYKDYTLTIKHYLKIFKNKVAIIGWIQNEKVDFHLKKNH